MMHQGRYSAGKEHKKRLEKSLTILKPNKPNPQKSFKGHSPTWFINDTVMLECWQSTVDHKGGQVILKKGTLQNL